MTSLMDPRDATVPDRPLFEEGDEVYWHTGLTRPDGEAVIRRAFIVRAPLCIREVNKPFLYRIRTEEDIKCGLPPHRYRTAWEGDLFPAEDDWSPSEFQPDSVA